MQVDPSERLILHGLVLGSYPILDLSRVDLVLDFKAIGWALLLPPLSKGHLSTLATWDWRSGDVGKSSFLHLQ